jgi:2-dehydro-3-deoxygalactonokinase
MSSAASKPALIGIDWGTSSLRAFLIDGRGEVLDSAFSPEGIMQLEGKSFDAVFTKTIQSLSAQSDLPIVVSGMITSRNGWVETPYVGMPTNPDILAQALVKHRTKSGALIHFITGATTEHAGGPDVMRGEETQIIGSAAVGFSDGLFVMPGTHSKWVRVSEGQIDDFSTYITGELFASLKGHTILGTLMERGPFDQHVFRRGVEVALQPDANLLHDLFHVRTLPLMGKIKGSQASDYLSGLLIGTEIAGAVGDMASQAEVIIVGRDDLADRYAVAIEACGLTSRRAPNDIAARGHHLIAQTAGLLS